MKQRRKTLWGKAAISVFRYFLKSMALTNRKQIASRQHRVLHCGQGCMFLETENTPFHFENFESGKEFSYEVQT
jgi:hypothetical protein